MWLKRRANWLEARAAIMAVAKYYRVASITETTAVVPERSLAGSIRAQPSSLLIQAHKAANAQKVVMLKNLYRALIATLSGM